MMMLATASQFLLVPVYLARFPDPTGFPVYVAVVPEGAGEPETSGYQSAFWSGGLAALLVRAGDYPSGRYLVYGRVTPGDGEDIRWLADRLRVG